MRARLTLISLLLLSLPLAGWQLVRSLEHSLRDSYQQALIDTTVAAARELASFEVGWPSDSGLYVHRADREPVIDGYDSEWLDWRAPSAWTDIDGAPGARLLAAEYRGRLNLLVEIPDDAFALNGNTDKDALSLELWIETGQESGRVMIQPAAPGWLESGGQDGRLRVQAALQPGDRFWRMEIALLEPLQVERLAVRVGPANNEQVAFRPLIRPIAALSGQLRARLPERTRGWLLHPEGWVLARAGQSAEMPSPQDDGGDVSKLLATLAARLLGVLPNSSGTDTPDAGRFPPQAMSRQPSADWYPLPDGAGFVVRATAPIMRDGNAVAHLLLERPADRFMNAAYEALLQLFVLGLAAMLLIAAILIGFAGRLSGRIRRLRDALDHAVGADGRVRAAMPGPEGHDEIADLGRSLSDMVERQHRHQDYLQSLASKLSHELRTPLAMIRSSLENLADSETPEQQEKYRQRAEEGTQRLQSMFRAMSQAARIEQSLSEEPLRPIDLAELVTAYVEGCRQTFRRHRFAAVVPSGSPVEVDASAEQLGQLLDKLVENAVDFTPPGERITLRVVPRGTQVCLQVDNPGPPLPPGLAEQAFESMVSNRSHDDCHDNRGPHLGLGLYIARLIAERHGGSIRAVDRPEGCRFEVELPRRNRRRSSEASRSRLDQEPL
nr:ATP-binding protein [Wenzhouxiangella sp. XN201]